MFKTKYEILNYHYKLKCIHVMAYYELNIMNIINSNSISHSNFHTKNIEMNCLLSLFI